MIVKHRNGYVAVDVTEKFPKVIVATPDAFPRVDLSVSVAPHHMREWAHVLLRAAEAWEELHGEELPPGDVTVSAKYPIAVVGNADMPSRAEIKKYVEEAKRGTGDRFGPWDGFGEGSRTLSPGRKPRRAKGKPGGAS